LQRVVRRFAAVMRGTCEVVVKEFLNAVEHGFLG